MSDGKSRYEIRIGNKGTVTTTLVSEGVLQGQACNQVLNLTRAMGKVTSHDEQCPTPDQPVNLGISIPGMGV